MEESRLRQNPRNPAFVSDLSAQKPPPPVLERFRSLLKQIQDQIRPTSSDADDDDTLPRPEMDEIVRLYEDVLSELTYNSKPIITDLTIIAGDQKEYGEGIADAICRRIVEVPAEQKLPSLYLLDSIVKNIGRNYVRYFAARLCEVFCEAYKQVHHSQYPAMRHLFGTWSTVFPPSILRKIESELLFSSAVSHQTSSWTASRPSESPSPRPAHGIHVNPKYLEARRQFEHSTVMHETDPSDNARMADFGGKGMERNASLSPKGWSGASPKFHGVQNERGVSSSLQAYERKPTIGYVEHDYDHAEALLPPQTAVRSASLVTGSESKLAPPKSKGLRASSATGIGQTRPLSPRSNGFARDISPGIVERASPSHSGFLSRLGRVNDRDGERSESWEGNWTDGGSRQIETSSPYTLSNGYEQRPPRALIDAYGNYRGKDTLQEKLSVVERLDENGNSKKTNRKWQNIEEEEYDWEDMSPTVIRGNDLIPSDSRASLKRPNAALLEPEFRSNSHSQAQLSQLGRESMTTKSLSTVTRNGSLPHFEVPYQAQEPWNLSHRFQPSSNPYLIPQSRGAALQMPFSGGGIVPSAGQKISPLDSKLEAEAPVRSFSSIQSRMGYSNPDTSNMAVLSSAAPASTMEKHLVQRPHSPPITPHIRPPLHNSLPQPLVHSLPHHAQFDLLDVNRLSVNHGPNKSLILSRPQFDGADRTSLNSSTLLQFPQQQAGLVSLIQPPSQEHAALTPAPGSHLVAQSLNHGPRHGQGSIRNAMFPNPFPGISSSSVTIHGIPGTSFHVPGGALPPLPPGPPPVSSQMGPTSQNKGPIISHHPPGSAFSGLIGSLMAQGLISLTAPVVPQDSVGLEFNSELLKVRHESAINALYADLPRQCTSCGQRFKSQEEHSNHMDWHVTKNRMSKNRKQNPSRKWFVSVKEWFSGAEALGTDSVPGFLPTEAVVEKREDEEMAVPADENQNVCALCGEPFDDFYSDETEEWMYKGAVYLNAQDGYTEVTDRSQLGPIVHAKCRSESTVVPTEDFEQNEEGLDEEGIQRKRMRI